MTVSRPDPALEALPEPELQVRTSARAKHIRLELRDRDTLLLVIPRGVDRAIALEFAAEKRAWVQRKRLEMDRRTVRRQPLRWDGQDRVPLRGETRALRVQAARRTRLQIDEPMVLHTAATDRRGRTRALIRCLREEARYDAERVIGEAVEGLGHRPSGLRIADQRTVWGSCASNGLISLSWRLVLAPPPVLRYVVVHELCHLVHRNHSRAFWSLVTRQLPEHPTARCWLREHGAGLHAVIPAP